MAPRGLAYRARARGKAGLDGAKGGDEAAGLAGGDREWPRRAGPGDGEVTAEAERGGAAATQLVGAGRMLAGRLEDGAPAAGP
jgi:hypothetical protein